MELELLVATLEELVDASPGLRPILVAILGLEVHLIPMDNFSSSKEDCLTVLELLQTKVSMDFRDENVQNLKRNF